TLTLVPGRTVTYDGTLSGAGNLTKLGPATLVLSGQNRFAGTTTITSGALIIDGHLAAAQVRAQGGALGGGGSIAGQVTMGDGSLLDLPIRQKSLTVNSTLALMPGSTTRVELDAARGSCGRIQ